MQVTNLISTMAIIAIITMVAVAPFVIWSLITRSIKSIRLSIYKRNNKREWDAYWSGQGTFGHCGQNIRCNCRSREPSGPMDVSYFFRKEQTDEMNRILERYSKSNALEK